jgi:O-antigen/teichoic acid export membrane protein
LRGRTARHAAIFLSTRAVNGALALVQVVVVTRAIGPDGAGQYFRLWTAAWLIAAVIRFGTDGILPRAVAEAELHGEDAVSIRRVLLTGSAVGLLALPMLVLAVGLPFELTSLGLTLSLGLACAGTWVFAALLKAHGRADLSGFVANVLWPLGSVVAPVPFLISGGTWQGVGTLTLLAWIVAFGAGAMVATRTLGAGPVRGLISRDGWEVPVGRDEVGAATLTSLYELLGWLPVVLTTLVGVGPAAAAAVFAATRVAGPFSWPYQSLTAVLVPRIARGFATRDRAALRHLLLRGGVAGALITWPICALGVLLARPLLELLDPSYADASTVLVLLIIARAVDAATGPVGEALLVGRRTWLDVRIVVIGIAIGTLTALVLAGGDDTLAVGIGAAVAFVLINLVRAVTLGRLLAMSSDDARTIGAPPGPGAVRSSP